MLGSIGIFWYNVRTDQEKKYSELLVQITRLQTQIELTATQLAFIQTNLQDRYTQQNADRDFTIRDKLIKNLDDRISRLERGNAP